MIAMAVAIVEVELGEVQQEEPQVEDFFLTRKFHLKAADWVLATCALIDEAPLACRRFVQNRIHDMLYCLVVRVDPDAISAVAVWLFCVGEEIGKVPFQLLWASAAHNELLKIGVVQQLDVWCLLRPAEITFQLTQRGIQRFVFAAFVKSDPLFTAKVYGKTVDCGTPIVGVKTKNPPGAFRCA